MPVRIHRVSTIVAALGLLAIWAMSPVDPALAQDASPPPAGRAWTDPPDRKATPSPVAAREEGKPQEVRKGNAPTRARQLAGSRRDAVPHRQVSRKASAPKVARRIAPADRQPIRRTAVRAPTHRSTGDRAWTVRAFQPSREEAPAYRYGYVPDEAPAYHRREDEVTDYRAARLRQAREAGYLVVRGSDLRTLRGRPLETLREPEDQDDPED